MQPRDEALLAYWQKRRQENEPVNENDLADYERELDAVRREMAPIKACIERIR